MERVDFVKLVELFHRTHRERVPFIQEHGILPPSEVGRSLPRLAPPEARAEADDYLDSLAPNEIPERRKNGIFLFMRNRSLSLMGGDNRVGILVKVDPVHCRVFDMVSYNNVVKEIRRGGKENADPHAWAYWHFSVPLKDFLKHFEPSGDLGWARKKRAPKSLPERVYWPEVITMKGIKPEHVGAEVLQG